jgi:hypothetical protein
MGFFDSVITQDDQQGGSSQQGSSTAATVAAVPASSEAVAGVDSDFLIIDETTNVSSVPDTVAEAVVVESAITEVATESASESAVTPLSFPDAMAVSYVAPGTEVGNVPDAIEALAEVATEVPNGTEAATLTEMIAPTVSEASFFQAPEASEPVSADSAFAASAEVSHVQTTETVALENPEAILSRAISELESVVRTKETERDATVRATEELNVRIAELKKQAKDSQDRAREIDASADRARSLIANLKSQIVPETVTA